jgi:MFS family permease
MYLSSSRAADTAATRNRSLRGGRLVAGNVLALGAVSFVTDISSEMVTAILPLYLVLTLGLSPLQFGALDGLYGGVTSLVRLLGGHVADRIGRPKFVAGLGYGISAVCKAGLLLAGSSAAFLGGVLAVDRTGKGLRTAPRDALITSSSDPDRLGTAFGVHRALDTAGALMGPLTAFAVLWAAPGAYDAVFVVSGCVATLGVVILVAFVREREPEPEKDHAPSTAPAKVSLRAALRLLLERRFGALCAVTAVLGLATISDSFVYLFLQSRLDIQTGFFPLLPLGTAAGFLLLALPLGRLADWCGTNVVFLGGHVALLSAYVLLRGPLGGLPLLVGVLALHGIFYAATDGVLVAAAGPMLPEELRTSGLALLQTGQSFARMLASVLLGTAWTLWGTTTALTASLVALTAALLIAGPLLAVGRPRRNVPDAPTVD